MPGIVGLISEEPREKCQAIVATMVSSMLHEPSYGSGGYAIPEMGVFGGWVTHEHSMASSQPFFGDDGNVVLLFAGELFTDSGSQPSTRASRTGDQGALYSLIQLYQQMGENCFPELNGLFSGLLVDKRRRKIFLFNDRYGMERIYWHTANNRFYFASEAKALLSVLPELRQFDLEGVAEFLSFGCTLSLRTLFRGIEILPSASLWSFDPPTCRKKRYFSPESWETLSPLTPSDFEEQFAHVFRTIVPRYCRAEAREVGISLTAGLDSRIIMAALPENSAPICHTFSGNDRDTLDASVAKRVAAACGVEHHVLRLGRDFLANFPSHADETIYLTDGALGPLGAHEVYFNRQARQLAPVRLTGVCGGEIMRGVTFLKPLGLPSALINKDLHRLIDQVRAERNAVQSHPLTFTASTELPRTRYGGIAASRSQMPFRTPYLDNDFISLAFRVPESLRGAARPGVTFVERTRPELARIPTDRGRLGSGGLLNYYMRRSVSELAFKLDYYRSEGVPRRLRWLDSTLSGLAAGTGIAGMHKFLLYRRWFRAELADYVGDALSMAATSKTQLWNPIFVAAMARQNRAGGFNFTREINAVLTLEAVGRMLFRDSHNKMLNHEGRGLFAMNKNKSIAAVGPTGV